jgi:hypothetical protein
LNNAAILKALAAHANVMQKTHQALAETCAGLHECYKASIEAGLAKAMPKEHFQDMADCHKAAGESWGRLKEKCAKADDAEFTKAIVSAVMSAVDEKYGSMVAPSLVKGAFQTVDPNAVSGLTLVGRTGQPTPPTSMESIPPELRSMVQE